MQCTLQLCVPQVLAASMTPCIQRAARFKTRLNFILETLNRLRGMQRPHLYENLQIYDRLEEG